MALLPGDARSDNANVEMLSQSGKRLLSVGAHPAFFERVLCELGVPEDHILLADKNPDLTNVSTAMKADVFDATEQWPEVGTFDLIIFPESLCISLSNKIEQESGLSPAKIIGSYPTDAREAELLASVLSEALSHLRPNGEIRANGPQSHPNVVRAASEQLRKMNHAHAIYYSRYFLRVTSARTGAQIFFS